MKQITIRVLLSDGVTVMTIKLKLKNLSVDKRKGVGE